jgi:hypothetical protein
MTPSHYSDYREIPSREHLWEDIENDCLRDYTLFQIEEGMLQKSEDSFQNLYHDCATFGYLNKIPKEILTKKNLLTTDNCGENVLHKAASYGYLDQLPKEILTPKLLLKEDNRNNNCLHYAAQRNQLQSLPEFSYQNLKTFQSHFQSNTSPSKEAILEFIQSKISKIEINLAKIRRSLTKSHQDIL